MVLLIYRNLCDTQKRGKLNVEQFALAMYLIAEKVRGKELPTELAPNMIPPSLRGKSPPSAAPIPAPSGGSQIPSSLSTSSLTSVSNQVPSSFLSTPTSAAAPPSTSLFSSPQTSSATSATPHLSTMTSAPLSVTPSLIPTPSGDMEVDKIAGFANDFSAIKELDNLTNEITGVKR